MQFQTVNPYAALVATAGPDNDKRSSSSGSPPSSGSSASLLIYNEGVKLPQTPSRPLVQTHSSSIMLQQHVSFTSFGTTCLVLTRLTSFHRSIAHRSRFALTTPALPTVHLLATAMVLVLLTPELITPLAVLPSAQQPPLPALLTATRLRKLPLWLASLSLLLSKRWLSARANWRVVVRLIPCRLVRLPDSSTSFGRHATSLAKSAAASVPQHLSIHLSRCSHGQS